VIEVGKSVGLMLRDLTHRNGGLRGMLVEFGKSTKAKQSHTEVEYIDEHAPAWCLALPEPDLREVLERTWERQMVEGSESRSGKRGQLGSS